MKRRDFLKCSGVAVVAPFWFRRKYEPTFHSPNNKCSGKYLRLEVIVEKVLLPSLHESTDYVSYSPSGYIFYDIYIKIDYQNYEEYYVYATMRVPKREKVNELVNMTSSELFKSFKKYHFICRIIFKPGFCVYIFINHYFSLIMK